MVVDIIPSAHEDISKNPFIIIVWCEAERAPARELSLFEDVVFLTYFKPVVAEEKVERREDFAFLAFEPSRLNVVIVNSFKKRDEGVSNVVALAVQCEFDGDSVSDGDFFLALSFTN